MWCRSCQQDVPAVASKEDATVRCARCHAGLSASPASHTTDRCAETSAESTVEVQPPAIAADDWPADALARDWERWELAEDLRKVDRLINALGVRRVDASHDACLATQESRTAAEPHGDRRGFSRSGSRPTGKSHQRSLCAWSILALGLVTAAAGAMLLVGSYWMNRADLSQLGMPLILAGQAALAIGLVVQLDAVRRSNQTAFESLDDLDDQLNELRHATTLLTSSQCSPSQSFYSHTAAGAGPQLLLADLKRQLDLLAIRLGNEARS